MLTQRLYFKPAAPDNNAQRAYDKIATPNPYASFLQVKFKNVSSMGIGVDVCESRSDCLEIVKIVLGICPRRLGNVYGALKLLRRAKWTLVQYFEKKPQISVKWHNGQNAISETSTEYSSHLFPRTNSAQPSSRDIVSSVFGLFF